MTANPTQSRQQRAIDTATDSGLFRRVERMTAASWLVPGTEYLFYVIRKEGADYRCECRAAQHGVPCIHAASVWVTVIRDQAGSSRVN